MYESRCVGCGDILALVGNLAVSRWWDCVVLVFVWQRVPPKQKKFPHWQTQVGAAAAESVVDVEFDVDVDERVERDEAFDDVEEEDTWRVGGCCCGCCL
jgi:hypothetical protein